MPSGTLQGDGEKLQLAPHAELPKEFSMKLRPALSPILRLLLTTTVALAFATPAGILATACSSDSQPTDSDPDPDPDPNPGSPAASILVLVDGSPVANGTVLFHDQDGLLVESVATGTDGIAAGHGLQATAVVTTASGTTLFTVDGLEEGDLVTVGDSKNGSQSISVTVSGTPVENAAGYLLDFGCASIGVDSIAAALVTLPESCRGSGTVFVVSLRSDGLPFSFATATGLDLSDADPAATLSPWSLEWDSLNLIARNMPAAAVAARAEVGFVHGGTPFGAYNTPQAIPAYPDARSSFIFVSPDVAEKRDITLGIALGKEQTIHGETVIRFWDETFELNLSLETSELLGGLFGLTVGASASGELASWDVATDPTIDGTLVSLAFPGNLRWKFLLPPAAATVVAPDLSSLGASAPNTAPTSFEIHAIDSDSIAGFRALRLGVAFDVLETPTPRLRVATAISPPITF